MAPRNPRPENHLTWGWGAWLADAAATSGAGHAVATGVSVRSLAGHKGVSYPAHRVHREVRSALDVAPGLADLGVSQDLHDRGHVDPEFVQDRAGGVAAPVVQAAVVDAGFRQQFLEFLPVPGGDRADGRRGE